MDRKILHMSVLSMAMLCLWLSGMGTSANPFLNMVQPVVYGRNLAWSISSCMERIHEAMFGSISPLWTIQKDEIALSYPTSYELYPTEVALSVLDDANQGENSECYEDDENTQAVCGPAANGQGVVYTAEMLHDFQYFLNEFYVVDASTYVDGLLDSDVFMSMDLSVQMSGEEPKVLIYHTHSQEAFADSQEGVWQDTVVGLGDRLKEELEVRYDVPVLHVTDTFDVIDGVTDRSEAYTYAEEKIWQVLAQYPSIEVIIDLHRDGVDEDTRLVTSINGKDTAQMMLLNGLCRTTTNGPISYLQNDYLTENLAFSFQVQLKAAEYYPTLMRKIYLRSYQYNLHIMPRCLLVECGAQTNTVEEAQNAMPLLADLLYLVLSGG